MYLADLRFASYYIVLGLWVLVWGLGGWLIGLGWYELVTVCLFLLVVGWY